MILHLDEAFVVADKPAGLPTVPGRPVDLHDCLWHRLRESVPDALVVHRLDMATSGLVLFARGTEAQRTLSRAFAQREVGKTYVALVCGEVANDCGEIDLPLAADWPNRPKQKVDRDAGKPSLTRWRVLSRAPGRTRLALEPLTGRSHQLRVHLLSIGHPILGDALYGDAATATASPRLLLHASALAFAHPLDARPMRFESPAPF